MIKIKRALLLSSLLLLTTIGCSPEKFKTYAKCENCQWEGFIMARKGVDINENKCPLCLQPSQRLKGWLYSKKPPTNAKIEEIYVGDGWWHVYWYPITLFSIPFWLLSPFIIIYIYNYIKNIKNLIKRPPLIETFDFEQFNKDLEKMELNISSKS